MLGAETLRSTDAWHSGQFDSLVSSIFWMISKPSPQKAQCRLPLGLYSYMGIRVGFRFIPGSPIVRARCQSSQDIQGLQGAETCHMRAGRKTGTLRRH